MKRNLRNLWLRQRDERDERVFFHDPQEILLNLFPANAKTDVIALGEQYVEKMRARIAKADVKYYSEGDLIHIEYPVFTDEYDRGNAAYQIDAILPTANVAEILCHRLKESIEYD
jgi:hypothetical protein